MRIQFLTTKIVLTLNFKSIDVLKITFFKPYNYFLFLKIELYAIFRKAVLVYFNSFLRGF